MRTRTIEIEILGCKIRVQGVRVREVLKKMADLFEGKYRLGEVKRANNCKELAKIFGEFLRNGVYPLYPPVSPVTVEAVEELVLRCRPLPGVRHYSYEFWRRLSDGRCRVKVCRYGAEETLHEVIWFKHDCYEYVDDKCPDMCPD